MNKICPFLSNYNAEGHARQYCEKSSCKLWNSSRGNCNINIISKLIGDIEYEM